MNAADVRVGMLISWKAPRVPTPEVAGLPAMPYVAPGGEVANPSSEQITSRVTSIERAANGDYLFHTERKIICRVAADGHVARGDR